MSVLAMLRVSCEPLTPACGKCSPTIRGRAPRNEKGRAPRRGSPPFSCVSASRFMRSLIVMPQLLHL